MRELWVLVPLHLEPSQPREQRMPIAAYHPEGACLCLCLCLLLHTLSSCQFSGFLQRVLPGLLLCCHLWEPPRSAWCQLTDRLIVGCSWRWLSVWPDKASCPRMIITLASVGTFWCQGSCWEAFCWYWFRRRLCRAEKTLKAVISTSHCKSGLELKSRWWKSRLLCCLLPHNQDSDSPK